MEKTTEKKKPSAFVRALKYIFVHNIIYKLAALLGGFLIWLVVSLA